MGSTAHTPSGKAVDVAIVGYGPVDAPRFACAVIVEHGGGGSGVAAPIVRDLLLDRPVFWIANPAYLHVTLAATAFIAWRIARGSERLTRPADLDRGARWTLALAAVLGFSLNLAIFIAVYRVATILAWRIRWGGGGPLAVDDDARALALNSCARGSSSAI